MSNITIFVADGMPAKALVTDVPASDDERITVADGLAAFLGGDVTVLMESPDHRIEIIR